MHGVEALLELLVARSVLVRVQLDPCFREHSDGRLEARWPLVWVLVPRIDLLTTTS